MLTAERLRELLSYDPETGVFINLTWRGGTANPGSVAGSIGNHGHRAIAIDGFKYLASRLAVLYMTGEWPAGEVDHRNHQPADDRWQNLREATSCQNNRNRRKLPNSSSQHKGVTWDKTRNKWKAQIKTGDGHNHFLGRFATEEKAHAAYLKAAQEHFGEFLPAA